MRELAQALLQLEDRRVQLRVRVPPLPVQVHLAARGARTVQDGYWTPGLSAGLLVYGRACPVACQPSASALHGANSFKLLTYAFWGIVIMQQFYGSKGAAVIAANNPVRI